MAHKHTRSHHKRMYPNWSPDQRVVGMGVPRNQKFPSPSPAFRQTLRINDELTRRVEAAEAAGRDHYDLHVLPGLRWPMWE